MRGLIIPCMDLKYMFKIQLQMDVDCLQMRECIISYHNYNNIQMNDMSIKLSRTTYWDTAVCGV